MTIASACQHKKHHWPHTRHDVAPHRTAVICSQKPTINCSYHNTRIFTNLLQGGRQVEQAPERHFCKRNRPIGTLPRPDTHTPPFLIPRASAQRTLRTLRHLVPCAAQLRGPPRGVLGGVQGGGGGGDHHVTKKGVATEGLEPVDPSPHVPCDRYINPMCVIPVVGAIAAGVQVWWLVHQTGAQQSTMNLTNTWLHNAETFTSIHPQQGWYRCHLFATYLPMLRSGATAHRRPCQTGRTAAPPRA